MTFTALTAKQLRAKRGTPAEIMAGQFALVDTELDTLTGRTLIQTIDLTASMVSATSLAANGADLASGTDATYYAVWCVPEACTIVSMETLLTEAYVMETTDAKIEVLDNAASPVTKVTYTLPAAGRAVKSHVSTTTIASAALAAGDILALKITATASSSGTGHAKVLLRYTVD